MKIEINIEKVIEQLEEQGYKPAIHAKWIETRNVFKCSNCDLIPRDANRKLVTVFPSTWDYCPNCGARMDGDENDNKTESDKSIADNAYLSKRWLETR